MQHTCRGKAEKPTWWHVHEGPPYRCHGGADNRDDAATLDEVCREDMDYQTFLVESLDPVLACPYVPKPGYYIEGRLQSSDTANAQV